MQHQPMEPIYIRTDKNGTKIYHDWNCPRCCGYGMLDKWINTGRVCYACGGSGKRVRAKIVKEYTPEYWAKLDAKHREKARKEAEKEAEILRAEAKKEAMIREAEGQANAIRAVQQANADGIGYLNEASPTAQVLQLKSLEAFIKAADGQATKIIIPSEIQGIAGLTKAVTEVATQK